MNEHPVTPQVTILEPTELYQLPWGWEAYPVMSEPGEVDYVFVCTPRVWEEPQPGTHVQSDLEPHEAGELIRRWLHDKRQVFAQRSRWFDPDDHRIAIFEVTTNSPHSDCR